MSANRIEAVAVFSKPHPDAPAVLRRIARALERHGARMLPDTTTAEALGLAESAGLRREEAAGSAGLVVSVGGDGTLLSAARSVGEREVPILGVNLGSLGFLTETRCEEVDQVLDLALRGRAPIDERTVLAVTLDGEPGPGNGFALNDVTFSKSDLARLFSLTLYVDDEWVADYRADGLILATPTGSTAYNLAAGGPVVVPGVEALVITPICPHSLSQRPIIVPGRCRVTIRLAEGQAATNVRVTLDGQTGFPLEPGSEVRIARAAHVVRLVRPPGRSFFAVLRDKLGWGHP